MIDAAIKQIQTILGTEPDGMWGPKTQAALDLLIHGPKVFPMEHHVKATSFADPADVIAFNKWYKVYREYLSHEEATKKAFEKGDNAIGYWEDSTAEGTGSSCALPPDDMIERWTSITAAKHKEVVVYANGHQVTCVLKDRMPWRKNITNGAGIDLNPDAITALDLTPPVMENAVWVWA